MTISDARTQLVRALTQKYGAGEAAAMARIVMEDAFDARRSNEALRLLDHNEQAHFEEISSRLLADEPVQYVLGQADFFGLKFRVSPAVLIPRQETEELVDWILEHLKTSVHSGPALLDIGLGSGCIAITLKKKWPDLQVWGLEKSADALAVAIENAHLILNRPDNTLSGLDFTQGDILNRQDWMKFPPLDVIVSNPPYIPLREKSYMPQHVLAYEPTLALFVADDDALLFYRVIADFAQAKLRPGGALFFECNEFNAQEVVALLKEKGFSDIELRKDLAGAERMIKASLKLS